MGTISEIKTPTRQQNANLLLLQNLLSCQPGTSPFTLLRDTLNQPARPVIEYYIRHAMASKTPVLYVSFETFPPPANITHFIKARRKEPSQIRQEIVSGLSSRQSKRLLVIIDTLHPLCTLPSPFSLATYLSSILSLYTVLSLVAVYHLDILLPVPDPPSLASSYDLISPTTRQKPDSRARKSAAIGMPVPYQPIPLTILTYLSTTILTASSFAEAVAKKKASDRSLTSPIFGIEEEKEGIITPLYPQDGNDGLVLHMEHRRKSGRIGTTARFYIPASSLSSSIAGKPIILASHPLFRPSTGEESQIAESEGGTFKLELTEQQRRARDGVVLPYFDAQKGEAGEGGRILYDMGVEDDFDEEEDEI